MSSQQVDFLQEAWANPEAAHAIYADEQYGILILPDAKPVVPVGHVMVVARETSIEELSDLRWLQLMMAGKIASEHITKVFRPERKVGFCMWGNQVPTPHVHVFPRNIQGDGATFFEKRPGATTAQLAETQRRLSSPHWAEEFRRRLGGITIKT